MIRRTRSLHVLAVALVLASPVRAQIILRSNIVEEQVTSAGDSYTGAIVLSNSSGRPHTAILYQTDYSFSADGFSHFDRPGGLPRSNADWVVLQERRVVVPARGSSMVPYTVVVPRTTTLRGTYWSTIMVEGAADGAEQGAATNSGISSVLRYAVQIATHVGAEGSRDVAFTNVSATQTDSSAALDLDVSDSGERAYRPTLSVEVYDEMGALRAKAKQNRGLLYPGTSLRQRFTLPRLPKGTYHAVVFADTGAESIFARQFTFTF